MEITISDALSTFSKIAGVSDVAIIGYDGFVIESTMSASFNDDALGAMLATEFARQETFGRELHLGELKEYITEFSGGNLLMIRLQQGILAVFSRHPLAINDDIKYQSTDVLKSIQL